MAVWFDHFFAWVEARPEAAAAVAAFLMVAITAIGLVAGWFGGLFRRLGHPTVAQPAVVIQPQPNTISLTIEEYERQQNRRATEVAAQTLNATGLERERLIIERAELGRRLAEIEPAFEQAQALIVKLQGSLERQGNQIGPERLARAEAALAAGDFDEADALIAEMEADEEPAVQRAARAAFGRGQIAEEQVRWDDAAEHYSRAAHLDATYKHVKKQRELLSRTGLYERAVALGSTVFDLAIREFGECSFEFAEALNDHAAVLSSLGRHAEAERLLRQAIDIGRATVGEAHVEYAIWLSNLAVLLQEMDQHEEAELLHRQSLDIAKATIGEAHPAYAYYLNNLAELLRLSGRYTEAEPLLRRAIEIDEATIGEAHPDHAIRLNNLSLLIEGMGQHAEARAVFAEMMPILRDALGNEHPKTKMGAANYAKLLHAHFPEDPALAELEAAFGPEIGR